MLPWVTAHFDIVLSMGAVLVLGALALIAGSRFHRQRGVAKLVWMCLHCGGRVRVYPYSRDIVCSHCGAWNALK